MALLTQSQLDHIRTIATQAGSGQGHYLAQSGSRLARALDEVLGDGGHEPPESAMHYDGSLDRIKAALSSWGIDHVEASYVVAAMVRLYEIAATHVAGFGARCTICADTAAVLAANQAAAVYQPA